MCLTLANAATIHHHTDPTGTTGSSARGYTATSPPRRAPHPRRQPGHPAGQPLQVQGLQQPRRQDRCETPPPASSPGRADLPGPHRRRQHTHRDSRRPERRPQQCRTGPAARRHRPQGHQHPPELRLRTPQRHLRRRQRKGQDRLHPALTRPVRRRHRRADLPKRRLPRSRCPQPLGDLPNPHHTRTRRIRPRRHHRNPRTGMNGRRRRAYRQWQTTTACSWPG